MRRDRPAAYRLLVFACWAATGCYASREIAPATLQNAGRGLGGGVAVATEAGEIVELRPSTNVRLWGVGGPSDWHDAGDLLFVPDGVVTGPPRDLDDATEAFVAELTGAEVFRLRALAPAGGVVEEGQRRRSIFIGFMDAAAAAEYETLLQDPRWVRVTAPARGTLATWARRFAADARSAEAPAAPLGTWRFLDPRHRALAPSLRGAALAGWPANDRLFVTAGARWSDLRAVELRSVDPLPTLAATVPILPLVFLAALAISSAGGEGNDTSSEPDLPGGGADRALVTSAACAPSCAPVATRLFDEQARRRGYVRGLASAGASVDTHADALAQIAAGVRLYDLTEIVLVMRGRSVTAGGDRSFERGLGLGMGIHAALREGSPWAGAFGLAAGATLVAPHLFWIDVRLGLRREIAGGMFLALPIVASFREAVAGMGSGAWSVGLGLDLGVTF